MNHYNCPFCANETLVNDKDGLFKHFIKCIECGARGPINSHIERSIKSWNERKGAERYTRNAIIQQLINQLQEMME